jgi:hypothetical protein
MVTYFNRKDLVSFGNYLLSDKRKELYKAIPDSKEGLKERLKNVSHADLENFLESIKKI